MQYQCPLSQGQSPFFYRHQKNKKIIDLVHPTLKFLVSYPIIPITQELKGVQMNC